LRVAVTDPLAAAHPLRGAAGPLRRDYAALASFLTERMEREVALVHLDSLLDAKKDPARAFDFVIGPHARVRTEAAAVRMPLRRMALLTNPAGSPAVRGVFVVPADSPVRHVDDLRGRTVLFGPPEVPERHAAALAALDERGVDAGRALRIHRHNRTCAGRVLRKEADAGVISDYATPILISEGTLRKGALRVVGRTRALPFITVFAKPTLDPAVARAVRSGLSAAGRNEALLLALQSGAGFVKPPAFWGADGRTRDADEDGDLADWPDWRGPGRDGGAALLPETLPEARRLLWKHPLTGPGHSGVAATRRHVVVADKSGDGSRDIWRCFDADTGVALWSLAYTAARKLDFTNSPRATPVIAGGRVYLLGALGHLHCAELATGKVLWKRSLPKDFGARIPDWGYSATPLLVDGALVVNPGARLASLAALDAVTGRTVWTTPGRPAAYASPVVATLGGRRQVVGCDAVSVGGWDPRSGERLWTLRLPGKNDYVVPTPVVAGDRLVVTTAGNGTRLYGFGPDGILRPEPLGAFPALAPDASTPVVLGRRLFGCADRLYCLDVRRGLRPVWQADDAAAFSEYVSLIAGNNRVLITTTAGELLLVDARAGEYRLVSRLSLSEHGTLVSHPALVGNRLYARHESALLCVLLSGSGFVDAETPEDRPPPPEDGKESLDRIDSLGE
jgi:outer membrane protein assembly factor BamB